MLNEKVTPFLFNNQLLMSIKINSQRTRSVHASQTINQLIFPMSEEQKIGSTKPKRLLSN